MSVLRFGRTLWFRSFAIVTLCASLNGCVDLDDAAVEGARDAPDQEQLDDQRNADAEEPAFRVCHSRFLLRRDGTGAQRRARVCGVER